MVYPGVRFSGWVLTNNNFMRITKSQQLRYDVIKQFLSKRHYEKDVVLLSPNPVIKERTLVDVRMESNGVHVTTNSPVVEVIKYRDITTLYMAIHSQPANNFKSFLSKRNRENSHL